MCNQIFRNLAGFAIFFLFASLQAINDFEDKSILTNEDFGPFYQTLLVRIAAVVIVANAGNSEAGGGDLSAVKKAVLQAVVGDGIREVAVTSITSQELREKVEASISEDGLKTMGPEKYIDILALAKLPQPCTGFVECPSLHSLGQSLSNMRTTCDSIDDVVSAKTLWGKTRKATKQKNRRDGEDPPTLQTTGALSD